MRTKKGVTAITSVLLILILAFGAFTQLRYCKSAKEIGLRDETPYGFGKEATVILLAGQSNAAGCSLDSYLKESVSPEKYAEYEKGYDNVYINYFVSGTNDSGGFVKCKARQGEFGERFGPELGLAEQLSKTYPEKTFFIIKYAWGGTNLYDQWISPSSGKTGNLYEGFMWHVKNSIRYLELKNYKVNIEGMCWMQGESDSIEDWSTESYETHLSNLITDVRAELWAFASDDGIAFVDAYIAAIIFWKNYERINEIKQSVADSSPMNSVIDTISAGLTTLGEPANEPDIAHYDALSEIKLGHLFADEVAKFFD